MSHKCNYNRKKSIPIKRFHIILRKRIRMFENKKKLEQNGNNRNKRLNLNKKSKGIK